MNPTADLFTDFPDSARLWIYVSSKDLSSEAQTDVLSCMRSFLNSWTSHDLPVTGQAKIIEGRFLCISAFVSGDEISGCGVDKSTRALNEIARTYKFEWLDGLHVSYRDEIGAIITSSRADFRILVQDGRIDGQTLVFDMSSDTLGDLRTRGMEKSASESWHSRVFKIPVSVPA